MLEKYARLADTLEYSVMALSVITSGALWALAADVAPKQLGWAGAVISTIVTGLTIYLYASGLQRKRKKAIVIRKEVGKFLAEVRGNPHLNEMEFWNKYKVYEGLVEELKFGKED